MYLNLRFRFFECKFFTFITLNPCGRTRLIFKINVKTKHEKDLFSFGLKKEPLKKVSSK